MRGCFVSLALCATLVSGCAIVGVPGSGTITTESREVSGFTAVALAGSGRLVVEQGEKETLSITADDNLLPLITSEVKDGKLRLGLKSNTSIKPSKEIEFRVGVKSLDGVDLSGSGNIDLKDLKGQELKVGLSGSGNIRAGGEVEKLELRISGSGKSDTTGLKCKDATITISGSGNVIVATSEALDVKLSGSGSVEYVGEPRVTQKISGSGSVKRR